MHDKDKNEKIERQNKEIFGYLFAIVVSLITTLITLRLAGVL